MGENVIDWENAKRITEESNNNLPASRLLAGDLVMVRVGEPGTTAIIPHEFDGCNCASMMIVRKHSSFNSEWLCFVMNSLLGHTQVAGVQYGTAQKQFNISDAVDFLYPVPELYEQKAIASTLSDIDNLLSALDRLIAKKRDLKQATMQQLLTGKKRLPGFRQKNRYKQTEIGLIPEDWDVQFLGTVIKSEPRYGINAAAVPYEGRYPAYIRITDISEDGYFQPSALVSVDHPNSEHYFLERGDLVFARTGASVGKSYLYNPEDGDLVFAGFLIKVQPQKDKLSPEFLAQYVKTYAYWNWVQVMSMRSGQPGINGNEFKQLLLPLPQIEEQISIAQVLTDMDSELTTLQTRRDKTQALKQAMMQELLTGRTRLV